MAISEERLGRRKRVQRLILDDTGYAFQPFEKVPADIKRIAGGKMTEETLVVLWNLPTGQILYRDDDDPKLGQDLFASPGQLWKEKRYRGQIEDYVAVLVGDLTAEIKTRKNI